MTKLIAGTGKYVYEVIRPWGDLPAGMEFGMISHVAVDARDRVYAFQRKDPPVLVFDRRGKFLRSWGSGMFADAHGIHVSADGHIFLGNRDAHTVVKCTLEGKVVMTLGTPGKPAFQEPFNHPADIAVGRNGDIYVADGYGNSRVHRFSSKGDLILSWGSPGKGPGQFSVPHGIWVDRNDRVYVVDREHGRVQVFTPEGEFIDQWTDFFRCMDVYVDADGAVFVTDLVPRLSVFDTKGKMIARGRPVLNTPHGIYGDSRGDLYIAEPSEQRLTKLVRQ
jgi:peptidylglycine monooxygenase